MKHLILVRHAKAETPSAMLKDFDRELASRGTNDAANMGLLLHDMKLKLDYVVASPSKRTTQTAELLVEQLGYAFDQVVWIDEIFEASARIMLKVVNELPHDKQTVMIIGHNPSISYLAEYLTGETIGDLPTCGVVGIDFDFESWDLVSQNSGHKKFNLTPKGE
jgi:phosphohistidine phosphatase